MKEKRKVVLLGDSILRGVVISEETEKYKINTLDFDGINNALNVDIQNCAKFGALVTNGYERIQNLVKTETGIFAAVLEFGGNDSDYNWKEVSANRAHDYIPRTPIDVFEKYLLLSIDLLRENNIKPIMMTLPPIAAKRYFNWIVKQGLNAENILYFIGDVDIIQRRQEAYNSIIYKVAKEKNTDIVDVRQNFLLHREYLSLMCEDGVHVNEKGQQLIFNAFINHYS